jgi:hypothetical protein
MVYHVEIRRSLHRAWAFNLDGERVGHEVVEPWLAGRPLRLGDRDWNPRDSALRVVEGPKLEAQELAFGKGWNAAQRSGKDVTRRLLGEAAARNGSEAAAQTDTLAAALSAALAAATARDPVLAPLRAHLVEDPQSLRMLASHLRQELAQRVR